MELKLTRMEIFPDGHMEKALVGFLLIVPIQILAPQTEDLIIRSLQPQNIRILSPQPLRLLHKPVAGGCSGNLAVPPVVSVKDQWGDYIEDGTTVTASVSGGTGQLLGATTAQTVDGVATFTNLNYSEPSQTFSISFSAGEYSVSSNPIVPSNSGCGGAEGFISTSPSSSNAITQNVEDSSSVSNSGGLSSVAPVMSTTTPPSSASPQQAPSGINPEEIKTYTQEKIDLVKQNIPSGQGSAFSQIVLVLQQMVSTLKSILGFVN